MPRKRELIENYGPNAACVYRVPGKGRSRIIDSKYEVDLCEDAAWQTVITFSSDRDARLFAQGAARALTGSFGR